MVCVCMRVFDVLTVHPLMNFIREPVCRWTFFTCIFKTCRGFTEWHHTFLGTIWDRTSVTFLNICLINLKSFLIWTVISNNLITPRLPPGCTTSIPESDRECYMWIKVEVTAQHHITPLFAIQQSLAFSMGMPCWGPKLFKVPVFQPWKHTNDHIFIPASAFFWDLLLEQTNTNAVS